MAPRNLPLSQYYFFNFELLILLFNYFPGKISKFPNRIFQTFSPKFQSPKTKISQRSQIRRKYSKNPEITQKTEKRAVSTLPLRKKQLQRRNKIVWASRSGASPRKTNRKRKNTQKFTDNRRTTNKKCTITTSNGTNSQATKKKSESQIKNIKKTAFNSQHSLNQS